MSVEATAKDNERLVRDYVTALWQDHEFDRVPEFVAESFTYADPTLSEPIRGPREFTAYLRETESSFSDFYVGIDTLVADDDAVLCEWTLTATHDGSMDGIPPTDRRMSINGMSIVHVEDGKLVDDRAYWDMQDVSAQLGLAFPAVVGQLPKLAYRKVAGLR
ncbi:ester cyclase [Natronorubrum sp. FCH18a]|uniref:ester cyclase n=1 Tax=Natronorubrum sp. FCH18a TaxID=3447018 RepID=UPI003F51522F